MTRKHILCLGLTRLQLYTLQCHFPITYELISITSEQLEDDAGLTALLSNSACVFINPKKLKNGQLQKILSQQAVTLQHAHASPLLFTDPFTDEQRASIDTRALHRINLRNGRTRDLIDITKLIKKANTPCFEGMEKMRSNVFNDGWYLIDFETSGFDALTDEMISLSIAYMADYRIEWEKTFYIRPSKPLSHTLEEITGITNEMLENGVSKEYVVQYLQQLPHEAPVILESADFYVPFLQALFLSCGERFELPVLPVKNLAAIVFGYLHCRGSYQILPHIKQRQYQRDAIENEYLAKLYDLTLALFENLQKRYDIHAASQLLQLYDDFT